MHANETASTLSEGDALLRRLFDAAVRRLHERGIEMHYSPAVLEWLRDQPDWRASLNPLRTLDGCWHQQVASAIEGLLLDGRLRQGNTLVVRMGETPTGPRVLFEVARPAEGEDGEGG
jgi:hypothetical protein